MRDHNASGIAAAFALAPEPVAAWFAGNRVRGSAPARGTGASVVLPDGLPGNGVRRRVEAVVDFRVGGGEGLVEVGFEVGFEVEVEVEVEVGRAGVGVAVPTSFAVGDPALQPLSARSASAPAAAVPRAVVFRRIVRSVSSGPPAVRVCHGARPSFTI